MRLGQALVYVPMSGTFVGYDHGCNNILQEDLVSEPGNLAGFVTGRIDLPEERNAERARELQRPWERDAKSLVSAAVKEGCEIKPGGGAC